MKGTDIDNLFLIDLLDVVPNPYPLYGGLCTPRTVGPGPETPSSPSPTDETKVSYQD